MSSRCKPVQVGVWLAARRLVGLVLSLTVMAIALPAPGVAQDRDGIYEVIRRDAEMRAARAAAARAAAPVHVQPMIQRQTRPAPAAPVFATPALQQTVRWITSPDRARVVPEVTVRPWIDAPAGRGAPGRNATITRRAGPAAAAAAPAVNSRQGASGDDVDFEMPGGPRAYCVRTCDGFFFPAGPALSSANGRQAQQFYCNQMCPNAEVLLYTVESSGSIEEAVGPNRQTYARLRTAFRFRNQLEAGCTCTGNATRGLASLPVTHDFTLRAGDVVVTEQGVRIFNGASRFPYRTADFVETRAYGRLPADVQRRVAEIQAGITARDSGAAAPVARTSGNSRLGARPAAQVATAVSAPTRSTMVDGVRVIDIPRPDPTPAPPVTAPRR